MRPNLLVPKGKLAIDVSKLKRKKIAEDLASGKPLHISASGDVTGKEQAELMTQRVSWHLSGILWIQNFMKPSAKL